MPPTPDSADIAARTTTARIDRGELLRDVARGLALEQKELDPKYFYDDRGSELFELITELPEYYLTRSERTLLLARIAEIISSVRPRSLVELGAGSATKTRIILDAMQTGGTGEQYVPVDVSRNFLEETATRLREIYPQLEITAAVGDFTRQLKLPWLERPTLFAFLGSTIGNFESESAIRILRRIAAQMCPDDRLLLGADLRKDPELIEAAYNDRAGVTAEFNLNILRVLNRELGANFDLSAFRHRAFYDRDRHRVEMHLDSDRDQTVLIPEIGSVRFLEGESIRSELSCKYDRPSVESLFERAGLRLERWITDADELFALALGGPVRTAL
ncbi:MAG TPA: L-histidine N(alpha)-methyltransferase [Gemmatimonadaceae bacterium]|nr:L-histidine N(alpha)-methyltransferase [Gemmatimonadaceae bacterium]